MSGAPRPRRLGLYIPWAIFALICVAWTAYWFMARDAAIRALESAVERANAAGVNAGYGGLRAGGYPLRLTLTLEDAHADPAPGIAFTAARLPVSINLSNPRHIIVGLGDGLHWRTNDGDHAMTVQRGELSIRLDDGGLARLSLDLDGARVVHDATAVTDIAKLLVHVRPDPRARADQQLVIEADDWRGPTPFAALSPLTPFTHFRAAIVVTESASLISRTPLASWDGALRIERLDVAWADARVVGDGTLDLDGAHRPAGALQLTPTGGQPVELRAANGWWTLAGLRVAQAKPLYSDAP